MSVWSERVKPPVAGCFVCIQAGYRIQWKVSSMHTVRHRFVCPPHWKDWQKVEGTMSFERFVYSVAAGRGLDLA